MVFKRPHSVRLNDSSLPIEPLSVTAALENQMYLCFTRKRNSKLDDFKAIKSVKYANAKLNVAMLRRFGCSS